MNNHNLILIRGGGDLASGVAYRFHRAGMKVLISELPEPLAVRRTVSFGEAVYEGAVEVEGITARRVEREQIQTAVDADEIPVLVDPEASILLTDYPIIVVIDARLTKLAPSPLPVDIPLHIGLGPGFYAGCNCHAVIETRRSHSLGRVYWDGTAQVDSGQPEGDQRRILRAPADGQINGYAQIGDRLEEGQKIAVIGEQYSVFSPFSGVLRGLIRPGMYVTKGLKIGDVDSRNNPAMCNLISDKALAIGGAALEAILSRERLRADLWM